MSPTFEEEELWDESQCGSLALARGSWDASPLRSPSLARGPWWDGDFSSIDDDDFDCALASLEDALFQGEHLAPCTSTSSVRRAGDDEEVTVVVPTATSVACSKQRTKRSNTSAATNTKKRSR